MPDDIIAEPVADLDYHLDLTALNRVNRAVAGLRRHEMVVVQGEDEVVVALAVETVTPEDLHRLQELAGSAPTLVLTGQRAAVLGLVADADTPAMNLTLPAGLDMATALTLADPTYPATAETAALAPRYAPAGNAAAAALELARLARLLPAVVVASLHLGRRNLDTWTGHHDCLKVSAKDVGEYRTHASRSLRQVAAASVPLADAENTRIVAFRPTDGGPEHLAIIIGEPDPEQPVLARLHSECYTGDLLGSLRCDCGDQLRGAIAEIARQGSGVVLYLAQEGRGIGLVNKLRAYRLQDSGLDTVDANEALGFDADERVYLPAAEMLRQLGFTTVRLLTNNPEKLRQLARCGIQVVERVAHIFPSNDHNAFYLRTKAERSGHMF